MRKKYCGNLYYMKNHFYISYFGNKRQEVEEIYKNLNFDGIDTIIEPFCGSCAMSYYIWLNNPNLKFILNDNNKFLKQMYELMKDDEKIKIFEEEFKQKCIYFKGNKERYLEVINDKDNLLSWFISSKVYSIRHGLFPTNRNYKEEIEFSNFPIYNFFKNADIEFYCEDAIYLYSKYKNLENCLILLDPPYLLSCNDFYLNSSTNIYEYLFKNSIYNEKSKIYLILENIWIIQLLFNIVDKKFITYKKTYEAKQKKTEHIIIKN